MSQGPNPETVYLTFDIDWAPDEVIGFTVELLQSLSIAQATFFVTHGTPLLDVLRRAGFELGIHPNLTGLLSGQESRRPETAIAELKRLVPEAACVRTHGLVRSTWLSTRFLDLGFSHESSLLIPAGSGIELSPFEHPDGLVQVPHNWGDYHHCSSGHRLSPSEYLSCRGLKVLNFHPIHLFLNTDGIETYFKARPYLRDLARLREYRQESRPGVRQFLEGLVTAARRAGGGFGRIGEIGLPHACESHRAA